MKVIFLWVLPSRGLYTLPAVREQLRDFLHEHPDTQVDVTVRTPGSLWSQLLSLFKRGPSDATRPHVVEIPSHWTATLAGLGLLEDLGEFEPDIDLDAWFGALRAHTQGAAVIHSLPWWMETPILYYRSDWLRRAGLDEVALESWTSLREACRRLGRKLPSGVHPIANGNPRDSVSLADLAPSVWSRGGDFLSRDGSRSLFQREEAYHGIRAYLELIDRGWMPLLGKSGLVTRSLFDGGAAMQFSGRLDLAHDRAPGPRGREMSPGTAFLSRGAAGPRRRSSDVRAVPTPRGDDTRSGVLLAHHLAVVRGAGHSREAAALARRLTRPAIGARYAATLGGLPCGTAELDATLSSAGALGPVLREALTLARPLPNVAALGTLERILDRCMEKLLRSILRRSFDPELLRQELIYAAAEMDYVLSMAPG